MLLASDNWFVRFWNAFKEQFLASFRVPDIGEEISQAILQKQTLVQIGGVTLLITDAVIVTWISVGLFIGLWIWIARKQELIPKGRQLLSESVVNMFVSLCKTNGMNQKQAETVAPFLGSVCFFLVASNVSSLFRLPPPAKNIAFPVALALLTIGYVIFISIRFVGVKGFMSSFVDPMPMMLPFKVLDYLIRPLSLALRLFGNVFGAFILMEFIYLILPAVIPGILGLWFDLADGLLQAVIFSYLSVTYIGEVLESAEVSAEKKHLRALAQEKSKP